MARVRCGGGGRNTRTPVREASPNGPRKSRSVLKTRNQSRLRGGHKDTLKCGLRGGASLLSHVRDAWSTGRAQRVLMPRALAG